MPKPSLWIFVAVLACDKSAPADASATAKAEPPLVCGLFQATSTDAMVALSKCTDEVSAAAAKAGADSTTPIPTCDTERAAVVAANEKYLECIDGQPGGGNVVDVAITRMKELTDDMCRCTDRKCTEDVSSRMAKLGEEFSKKFEGKDEPKPDEAQTKVLEETVKRLSECMMKVSTGG